MITRAWCSFCVLLLFFQLPCVSASFFSQEFDPLENRLYALLDAGGSGGFEVECKKIFAKLGYYVGGGLGYKMLPWVRLQGEFIYQRAELRSVAQATSQGIVKLKHLNGYLNAYCGLATLLLDFNCQFAVRPLIGVGVGYGNVSSSWTGEFAHLGQNCYVIQNSEKQRGQFKKNGVAGQVIAALRYQLCCSWEGSVEYRYIKIVDAVSSHHLGASLDYLF